MPNGIHGYAFAFGLGLPEQALGSHPGTSRWLGLARGQNTPRPPSPHRGSVRNGLVPTPYENVQCLG